MAKPKYDYWLTEEGLTLITGWAREGLTEAQICKNMGIAVSSLTSWKVDHPTILAALKEGKEVVDFQVENALYKRAISGDVTACIFWLKNRKTAQWRDKPAPKDEDDSRNILEKLTEALSAKSKQ